MRINGEWYLCDDGVVRPVIRAEVMNVSGFWEPALFLVDTGADRTVLNAAMLELLGFQPTEMIDGIAGIGGAANSVVINTRVRLSCEDESKAVFRGEFVAVMHLEALDISVLGRDIIEMLSVIVDRRAEIVCLLGQGHRYIIEGP
jgi:predicted aspartyl protease